VKGNSFEPVVILKGARGRLQCARELTTPVEGLYLAGYNSYMRFYPTRLYLRTLLICTIFAAGIVLLKRNAWAADVSVVYVAGLAYVLPSVIARPTVTLSGDGMLTYSLFGKIRQRVNLQSLTNCKYLYKGLFGPGVQGSYAGVFNMAWHLYDADGGSATFPANWWADRHQVAMSLSSAVTKQGIPVNRRTAKKLGLLKARDVSPN
jgi:hypothetical protein